MQRYTLLPLIFFLLLFNSCGFFDEVDPHDTDTKQHIDFNHQTRTGTIITYYRDGERKTKCYYKRGRRDGQFRSWYINGNPKLEIMYKDGDKHGTYKYYRQDGALWRKIEFKDDLRHGLFQEYWSNGNLKVELEHDRGEPINSTLKEYAESGKTKTEKALVINTKNTVQLDNKYIVYVYFEHMPKKAYYSAEVDGVDYYLPQENGKGIMEFEVLPGQVVMQKVRFTGTYEGRQKTRIEASKDFNIGVENY